MRPFLILFLLLGLTACVSQAQKVIPPVEYNQSVDVHFNQHAVLIWRSGEVLSSEYFIQPAYNADYPLASVLAAVVTNEIHKKHKDRYIYKYGKEQQVVFMTSLKNILSKHHVFKTVKMIDNEKKIRPDQVAIIIDFVRTRVGSQEMGLPITLKGNIVIKFKNQHFEKPFFVHSTSEDTHGFSSFYKKEQNISQQLMNKVLKTIQLWGRQHSIV